VAGDGIPLPASAPPDSLSLGGVIRLLLIASPGSIVGDRRGVEREAKDSCCHTAHNIYHLDLIVAG
jgi:hypothetical protein